MFKKRFVVIVVLFILSTLIFFENSFTDITSENNVFLSPPSYYDYRNVDNKVIGDLVSRGGLTRLDTDISRDCTDPTISQGYNLYTNHFNKKTGAILMDNCGNILHQWYVPKFKDYYWMYVEPDTISNNGELYVLQQGPTKETFLKIDNESNVLFSLDGYLYHHDLDIDSDGTIYALGEKSKQWLLIENEKVPISELTINKISRNGTLQEEVFLMKHFTEKPYIKSHIKQFFENRRPIGNILHTNTIEILQKDIPGIAKKGDLLVCARNINLIFIFNFEREEIIWEWGEEDLQFPHHPTILENGNILIYDNGDSRRNYTRIVELNPMTKEIEWEYSQDTKGERFFNSLRGSSQILPNDNILITDSDNLRVFEITKEKEILWEWTNPLNDTYSNKIVYRMMRYPKDVFSGFTFNNGTLPS